MTDDIMTVVSNIAGETGVLFLEMAPYLLLGLTVAGILSVVMKKRFVARHVGRPGIGSVVKASLLGVPLPLCSCGVVPTAAYLKRAGASRPAVMSFLISTPQTGVDSIAATYGMLGPLFAIFRPIAALLTGILGGSVSAFSLRNDRTDDRDSGPTADATTSPASHQQAHSEPRQTLKERFHAFVDYAYVEAVDDIAIHFLFGLLVGGVIAVVLPTDFFVGRTFGSGLPAMLLMVVIGIPMYVCSTSSIPIAVALIAKGLSPGAAYVFLVAGPATNAATLAVLSRVLGRKQTMLYVGVLIVGSLIFGPTMEWITGLVGWDPSVIQSGMVHTGLASWLVYGSATALAALIALALFRAIRSRVRKAKTAGAAPGTGQTEAPDRVGGLSDEIGVLSMGVHGMTCHHCATNVADAVRSVVDSESIEVDLDRHIVRVSGVPDIDSHVVAHAIREAGYDPVE